MIQIKSFGDQDFSRSNVAKITARAVEDILYVLDSATAPNGSNGTGEFTDKEVKLYREFRNWFGPQVGAAIQGLVVGPILSCLEVQEDGFADIVELRDRTYDDDGMTIESRTRSRLLWLAEEIPSLVETYGQLDPDEIEDAVNLSITVRSFLEHGFNIDEAGPLLVEAEKWFMFSQPGAKILRGDEDAVEALMDLTTRLRREIDTCEGERRKARSDIDSGSVGQDSHAYAMDELHRVEASITGLEERLAELDLKRQKITDSITSGGL